MISGLSGSGSSALLQQMRERMMSRIDADGDGAITQAEFTSGRPQGASEADAAERFAAIDADGDGSLTETEISSHFQQLAPRTQGALLMAQGMRCEGGGGERPNPVAALMSKVDGDGDGSISKSELEAALASVATDDTDDAAAAEALFAALDSDGDGAVSEDEVAQAMAPPRGHHGPPPPPPGGSDEVSSDEIFSQLDANGDGVISQEEFAAATGQSTAASGTATAASEDDTTQSLLALLQGATGQQAASTVRAQMMDLLLKLQATDAAA